MIENSEQSELLGKVCLLYLQKVYYIFEYDFNTTGLINSLANLKDQSGLQTQPFNSIVSI